MLNKKGLEKYGKATILLDNLSVILLLTLGTIACSLYNAFFGLLYLIIFSIIIYIIMRKLVCTRCYYYGKWCHTGWGKLSRLLFKKGEIEEFKNCLGGKIAPLIYMSLSLIPIIFLILSFFEDMVLKISLMVAIIVLTVLSSTIGRKKSCKSCKMNKICPGSLVKQ